MEHTVRYEAGLCVHDHYAFKLDLRCARLDDMRAIFVARFAEFWCQMNCSGAWRVVETDHFLHVFFDLPKDFMFFKISAEAFEYDYESSCSMVD